MRFLVDNALSPEVAEGLRRAGHDHIEAEVTLAADWCRKHPVEGTQLEIVRLLSA